jgi:hypothetical protein
LVIDMMPEDGVLLHRFVRLEVHQPVGLEVRDATVARDECDRAGKRLRSDVPLHQLPDAFQTVGRESDVLGTRGRSRRRQGHQAEGDESNDRQMFAHGDDTH